VGDPINCAVEAEARFVEPLIFNHDDPGELDRPRQQHAMLSDIGLVLQRIKLNFHNYQ